MKLFDGSLHEWIMITKVLGHEKARISLSKSAGVGLSWGEVPRMNGSKNTRPIEMLADQCTDEHTAASQLWCTLATHLTEQQVELHVVTELQLVK